MRVYASSMRRDITPEEEGERFLTLQAAHGYSAVKFRIGKECGHDEDEWPGRTETIVPMIRRAMGDGVDLLVDANCCYTPAKAIAVAGMLEACRVCHFEEPCPYWEYEWTAQVTHALKALRIQVAGGEQDCSLQTWRRMINLHAFDVVQPDICYVGGLTRALRVAAMAREAGLLCVPHSANLSLVTVFTLHTMGASENAGPYVEFSIEPASYYPWQLGIFHPALVARNGMVQIPDGPGWGVEISPSWLESTDRRISESN
jgi:L-alanine-DL-glutamate epimerase-like enolase superfamily enzyme